MRKTVSIYNQQVARHLTKLFDSMAKLKFEKDSEGNDAKVALGMFSKDGEYVDMDQACDLGGQVCFECPPSSSLKLNL